MLVRLLSPVFVALLTIGCASDAPNGARGDSARQASGQVPADEVVLTLPRKVAPETESTEPRPTNASAMVGTEIEKVFQIE